MNHLTDAVSGMLDPRSLVGAALIGAIVLGLASVVVVLLRRSVRRIELHLSDVTALRFVSAFAQVLVYLIGFVLYAHLVPELRALGTALLTGASVVSVVVGLAAKDTLGNLVAGFSLVLYRQVRVGDTIRIASPLGVISANVQVISLGFTVLVDEEKHDVVVPNSTMMSNTIIRVGRAFDQMRMHGF
jgi:small-conductance mechanosensitive channel